jgi:aryl-alcohol dehydrogenase-like predicted oxidoreductase
MIIVPSFLLQFSGVKFNCDVMDANFLNTQFGKNGPNVFRLGLSATYRPGRKTIYRAVEEGINFFFAYGFDSHMVSVLKEIFQKDRGKYILATGAYNLIVGHPNLRRTLEKRLRQFKTEYIDVFLFLGVMKEKQMTESVKEEFLKFREEGKVHFVGISTHDRKLAGRLMAEGDFNSIMMRYNAAHRGAEEDIFPCLAKHNPGVISYTATRWRYLIRRPRNWPEDSRIPDAGMCYRFVLSNPNVDVCLTAPANIKQLQENINAVRHGPLNEEDMTFIKEFGDRVHHTRKWFM